MTPPELEAESRKYSNIAAIVLKLSDGQWAIFNNQRKLLRITPSMELMCLTIAEAGSTIIEPRPLTVSDLDLDSVLAEI